MMNKGFEKMIGQDLEVYVDDMIIKSNNPEQHTQKQQIVEAPPQPSLEELVRQMTMQNMQFQQETRASIQSLTN